MSRYEIAFSGQLQPGASLDQVKANLARLFQADEQRIAMLFSGRRIVIKSGLDAAGAEKYRATIERAGALAEVRALDVEIEEVELAPPPVATAPQPAAIQPATTQSATPPPATTQPVTAASFGGSAKVIPRDEYMAAFADVEAPDFGIAPLGVDLQDVQPPAQAPAVDLSQFSLAPAGSDMGEIPRSLDGPQPDISHLRLEP